MGNLTNPDLIHYLACPNCNNELFVVERCLKCISCKKEFEIKDGIPLLYPDNINLEHLQTEESLAKVIKMKPLNENEKLNKIQWEKSKQEFWGMVKKNVKPPLKSIINLGCGYDSSFKYLEKQGYLFVNFDLVFEMLHFLQRDHGAISCIAGDINNLPFKQHSFDYVISIDVIHHESKKLTSLLRSFGNLLKPEGALFLEDPNAWGIFQCMRSIFIPRLIYRTMRSAFFNVRQTPHRPADYEFPTNVWHVIRLLEKLGFGNIKVYPNNAYPCISQTKYKIYTSLHKSEWFKKYHNYHYMISAKKP